MFSKSKVFIAALMVSASSIAAANGGKTYALADVVDVEPIVRYVTVETPVRECYQVQQQPETRRARPKPGAVLAGGILGAVVGRQFGSGGGRDAATVAGSLIGAAVASEKSSQRYTYRDQGRTIKQCDITYETHQEERIDGYWVTYEYQGQRYRTRTSDHPGETLEVSVTVRPAR